MENIIPRQPLVSVITASFNAAQHVRQTIESVLNQTYPDIEYIIIDGGSTDGTVEIIKEYTGRLAYWVSEPDEGIYDAWNKALARANGDWICFLGADDVFYSPTILMDVINATLGSEIPLDLLHGQLAIIKNGTERLFGKPWAWKRFSVHMDIAQPGALHHRRLFEKYGLFDREFKISGDYEFLLRPNTELKTKYFHFPFVKMGAYGKSRTKVMQTLLESYSAQKKSQHIARHRPMINFLITLLKYNVNSIMGRF